MDINLIDTLLALEKKCLQEDRERLHTARSLLSTSDTYKNSIKSVSFYNDNNNSYNTNVSDENVSMQNNSNESANNRTNNMQQAKSIDLLNDTKNNIAGFDEGKCRSTSLSKENENSYELFTQNATDNELDEGSTILPELVPEMNLDFSNMYLEEDLKDMDVNGALSKHAKEMVNQHAASSVKENITSQVSTMQQKKKHKENQDDMEQWVSDTFYSYFPSYNNEYQKRQNYLRERQQENQQNFLKHQQQAKPPMSKSQQKKQAGTLAAPQYPNTTRSSSTSTTDKTDLEILALNNPDYVPPKYNHNNARPATNRHRLLQDLKHTDLSNMLSDNGVVERNRHNAESILAGKQNYQRELMLQIEEKRRNIERFRERERLQEEAITRRLEEQLKTIQLEEQLEKDKMHQDRILFDNAQSRLLREHLLAKLEHDTKLLNSNKNLTTSTSNNYNHNNNNKNNNNDNDMGKIDRNRVYQYFSNSARHEYRRGEPLPAEVELDVEIPERVPDMRKMQHGERECFHLSEHVCPQCDAPLRMFESSCLRCQRKLSMKTKVHRKAETQQTKSQSQCNGNLKNEQEKTITTTTTTATIANEGDNKQTNQEPKTANNKGSNVAEKNVHDNKIATDSMDTDADDVVVEDVRSYSLVCTNCERLYAMCPTCLSQSDVCRACHRKRNVCLNCRRTLCSFCLEEIASGRDMEHTHINEANIHKFRAKAPYTQEHNNNAFQVLEVNYQTTDESNECAPAPSTEEAENSKTKYLVPETAATYLPTASAYGHNLADNHVLNNKLPQDKAASSERLADHAPYAMHIERNSICHDEHAAKANNLHDQVPAVAEIARLLPAVDVSDIQTAEIERLELLHRETERRMSRYMKNYGDLAQRQILRSKSESRGTQTTPVSAGRRDIVLHEDNNLSMPLLREMPKMTRREARRSQPPSAASNHSQSNIENLKRRWEIPAVQKFCITSKSPRVLTQVGAIRQQLQAASLFDDDDTDAAEYY